MPDFPPTRRLTAKMPKVISAVILAAGLSSRMGGRPKALLPVSGADTFVTRIARTFHESAIRDIVVVVGHEATEVIRVIDASGVQVRVVENMRYRDGQFSSIVAGLNAV